jgi:phosphoenolpyruvate-protein phosphotransferase
VKTAGTLLHGVAAAAGVGFGPAREIARDPVPAARRVASADVAAEIALLRDAARSASMELRTMARAVRADGHADEAAIFVAHAAIAADPAIIDGAVAEIQARGVDAATAIVAATSAAAAQIEGLSDELLRARAADVRDVGDRIARTLVGVVEAELLPEPAVIVGEDLAPSLAATLPRERLLGIALEGSSATAHAAILARAYGIPAVVGVAGLLAAVRAAGPAVHVAIDGSSGEVIVDPDPVSRDRFRDRMASAESARRRDVDDAGLAPETLDGLAITLLANIGTPAEAGTAAALGARGVGLFRTEFLFLERPSPPSEDEQVDAYRQAVEAFGGNPVTIRLLDVGGDKPIPYLALPPEDNPFLGVRALRLAGDRPELFLTQLRAAYRAAASGPVKVMAPMVADASDVATLLELVAEARVGLDHDSVPRGEISIGVMVEIPSAVLAADSFLGEVAFASLGTNDLLQYTIAADRGNAALRRYHDPLHPALLRLVRLSVEAADRAGIELSVCGEMAGDPIAALALVGLGVRQLSMTPSSLGPVRRAIRSADASVLERLALAALTDASAEGVRARFAAVAVSADSARRGS